MFLSIVSLFAVLFVLALTATLLFRLLGCGDCGRTNGLCESCKSGPFGCNEE